MNTTTIIELLSSNLPFIMALTLGITEVLKRLAGWNSEENLNKKRFLPLIALITGMSFGVLIISPDTTGLVIGMIAGLGASGLWDFGTSTVSIIKDK